MSLVNEALNKAERDCRTRGAPERCQPSMRLYGDETPETPGRNSPASEEISGLSGKQRPGVRGVVLLGACLVATVAIIMYRSLPSENSGPTPASASNSASPQPPAAGNVPAETVNTAEARPPGLGGLIGLPFMKSAAGPSIALPEQPPPPPEPNGKAAPPKVAAPVKPPAVARFTLGGIVVTGRNIRAIINDQPVSVGDRIDGARVIAIGRNRVILEKDGKQLTLRL